MQELKKIGVLAAAKIGGLFGVVMGLFYGILYMISLTVAPDVLSQMPDSAGMVWGYEAIITFPIMLGVIYFLVGLIGSFVYNRFAKWIGGIPIELGKK